MIGDDVGYKVGLAAAPLEVGTSVANGDDVVLLGSSTGTGVG